MGKFPEAEARLFHDKFVCKNCKKVTKASSMDVSEGKATCKNCGSKNLRPKRR